MALAVPYDEMTPREKIFYDLDDQLHGIMDWALILFDMLSPQGPLDEQRANAAVRVIGELLTIGQSLDEAFAKAFQGPPGPKLVKLHPAS